MHITMYISTYPNTSLKHQIKSVTNDSVFWNAQVVAGVGSVAVR